MSPHVEFKRISQKLPKEEQSRMANYPHASLVQRYSRQMLVPNMEGMQGQLALRDSRVLIIGAGGIGSSVILYLAGAGVNMTLVDFDVVEVSNLHRQVIHDTAAACTLTNKATSAAARVKALNPDISCDTVLEKLSRSNAVEIMTRQRFDVVVDATDNFEARYLINDTCNHLALPLVSGSAVGMEGQVTVFQPRSGRACYRCLHPNPSPAESCRSCANAGVVGPVPGVIGILQSVEVIKLLVKNTDKGSSESGNKKLINLVGRQLYYDAAASEFHEFQLPARNEGCLSCRHLYSSSSSCALERDESAVVLFAAAVDVPPCPAVPALSSHHLISAAEYNSTVLQRGLPHLLLDLLNIPLADLQGSCPPGEGLGALQTLRAALYPAGAESPRPLYLLCRRGVDSVAATQLLLTSADYFREGRCKAESLGTVISEEKKQQLQIFNVEGGLTSWHSDVDQSFPIY